MNAVEQVWAAMDAADDAVAIAAIVAAAFDQAEVDEHLWADAFVEAMAAMAAATNGPGPIVVRVDMSAVARRREDGRALAELMLADIDTAKRRGVPAELVVKREALLEEVSPGRSLCRARARQLRRSVGVR